MKTFNTAGKCIPTLHYMADIDRQVGSAIELVHNGRYFCINRGRQYGKTTTLAEVKKRLESEGYAVFSLSFEGLENEVFSSVTRLLYVTLYMMHSKLILGAVQNLSEESISLLEEFGHYDRGEISSMRYRTLIPHLCNTDKVVLIIDEVDQAGNYQEFVKFLGLLRDMYICRDEAGTFLSVILAGVYDVKNLKLKISTWNISVPYDADMSISSDRISKMVAEYKVDHGLDFDEDFVGQMIYDYTSGYPFLVSRICEIMDLQGYSWDKNGLLMAIHDLLVERNTLFDDMVKKNG